MRARSFRLVLLAAALLLAGGCDQAADNLFTFNVDGVRFTFAFQGADVAGTEASVVSEEVQNVLEEIRDEGFGPEEVVRVRLIPGEAQIRIVSAPAGVDIGFLDDVSLRLVDGGGGSTEVASAEDVETPPGMVSEVELEVSGEDVADVVTAGDFSARLDVSGDQALTPDGAYRLEVRFDVEVAVEGL
jgi:hypothetical protein